MNLQKSIKFTTEEVDQLLKIQNKYQQNTYEFGQLYLEKLAWDERAKQLIDLENKKRNELTAIQKEEENWRNRITEKYGEGTLNINDGVFIPSEPHK